MRPILFQWRRLTIYSYAAMLYAGIVTGVYAQVFLARAAGLEAVRVLAATLILLVPALAGARLLYVAVHWRQFRAAPDRVLRAGEGGAAMYGGLLLAVPASIPLLRVLDVPFGTFWDLASFTMLIGMIFARVGCQLRGCCAGRPSTSRWAMVLPNARGVWERRLPTQIFEASWALAILVVAWSVWRLYVFPGAVFLVTLGGYGAGRVALDSLRDASDAMLLGVRLHQLLSMAFVAAAMIAYVAIR
jgi:phosphatidylglycerol:prolipoprotein diacylglycerol transferase